MPLFVTCAGCGGSIGGLFSEEKHYVCFACKRDYHTKCFIDTGGHLEVQGIVVRFLLEAKAATDLANIVRRDKIAQIRAPTQRLMEEEYSRVQSMSGDDLLRRCRINLCGECVAEDHTRQVVRSLETARRYDDAIELSDGLHLHKEAGRLRDIKLDGERQKSTKTVKLVSVNLNDLIERIGRSGLAIPYKCPNCGAAITIDKNARVEGLKFCSYCGGALNIELLETILREALD